MLLDFTWGSVSYSCWINPCDFWRWRCQEISFEWLEHPWPWNYDLGRHWSYVSSAIYKRVYIHIISLVVEPFWIHLVSDLNTRNFKFDISYCTRIFEFDFSVWYIFKIWIPFNLQTVGQCMYINKSNHQSGPMQFWSGLVPTKCQYMLVSINLTVPIDIIRAFVVSLLTDSN